ncbi:DUF885 family protein [Caulobacter mirabilis]|nr:DUF885 family protein [Caulobacter mirabilis]
MRIVRRRFIQCAGAAGLIGLGTPVAARADDTLDGVVTEFMSTPPGLRSNAILYRKADEEFPDLSYEGSERAAAQARRWIARLSPLKSAPLDDDARDTLGVLLWELETSLGHHRYYWLDSPLSADGSAIEIGIGRLATAPLQTTADLDQYLARLEAFPAYVGQVETKVRGQESRRVLSHRETVIAEVGHLDRILAAPADAFVPATGRLSKIPAAAAARFQATARALTEGRVVPALRRLADYLRSDYLPRTNDAVGLWRLPEGADYYRFLLRSNVTLDLDPSDVHARTLETVAEADRDLAALRREIGFQGSAEAFHAELLTGARWKASSVEEVSDRFTAGLRRFDPVYARFFERPPSTPFGVEPQAPEYNDIGDGHRQRACHSGPIAKTLWVSARRGVWVLPKYINGKPADKTAMPHWMPRKLGLSLARKMIKRTLGPWRTTGFPSRTTSRWEAHPSVSGEFLTRAGCGDVKFKPAIKALEGRKVRFADDSVEDVDAIVFATGYDMRFPFFDDPNLLPDADHRLPLFKRMMKPGAPNLFYMALAQPLPTLVNFAEQQSKLVAAYLTGRYMPPPDAEMERIIAKDEETHMAHYYKAKRHTIQVDFGVYVHDLLREIERGGRRAAAAGNRLPVPARAETVKA